MGIIREFRDFVSGISLPDNLNGLWGSMPSAAGVTVNEMAALQSAAVVGCVRIVSGLLASLPLHVMEITKGGRRVAGDHSLEYLLSAQPNSETDAFTFKETLEMHLLLNGNAYGELVYDNGGQLAAIYQRSPFKTRPYRLPNGELVFKTTDGAMLGGEREVQADHMLHLKGLSMDGIYGLNPIQAFARDTIGLDLGLRQFGSRLIANNASPSGVLLTDKILKEDHRKKLESSWKAGHAQGNAHQFAVLDGGLKWQSISMSPEESQFLLTRNYQRSEIAAIYGVPPHLLGDHMERAGANIEQQMLQFLNFTLKPWLRRWEAGLTAKLLPKLGRTAGKYQIAFDTSEMERGDYQSMLNGLSVGRQWGLYTANEARAILRLNPYTEDQEAAADQLWQPVNMILAQDVAAAKAAPPPSPTAPKPEGKSFDPINTHSRVFKDAFGRIQARSKVDYATFTRVFSPSLLAVADQYLMTADTEFRSGDSIPPTIVNFVTDYMGAMQKRSSTWTPESADAEFSRATAAIKTAVDREPQETANE
jgi:HK97 family phage portal protein